MSRFRIMQFNMQFGRGWDPADPDHAPIDLARTIAEIRRHKADIVLLQEVEQAQPRGFQANPPPNFTRLKAALPEYSSYFRYPKADPRELPFGVGLAIFSKTPLRNTRYWDLPSPQIHFKFRGKTSSPTDRLMIAADTRIDGRVLHVFNCHLLALFMLDSSSEMHGEQRKLVVRRMRALRGPALIGGDFNVTKLESLLRQFRAAGYRSVQTKKITWRRKPYVLDHIFYNPSLRRVAHTVRATPASDHHVLVADFVFADPA
jgi:endonuclease/exonuclease/phosphatase family metal-dependent hydrolase